MVKSVAELCNGQVVTCLYKGGPRSAKPGEVTRRTGRVLESAVVSRKTGALVIKIDQGLDGAEEIRSLSEDHILGGTIEVLPEA